MINDNTAEGQPGHKMALMAIHTLVQTIETYSTKWKYQKSAATISDIHRNVLVYLRKIYTAKLSYSVYCLLYFLWPS